MQSVITANKPKGTKKASPEHPSGDKRFKILDATMKRHQYRPDALIELLHKAQEAFGFLEDGVLLYIAHSLKLPPSKVYGVAAFYIYGRAEYPLAISRLQKAIQQAKKLGVLGTEIFGSPFDFRIDIRVGAGAFVCGEETALIASIEGGRGTPRPRPPYPAEWGLWGSPTLINNGGYR